MHTVSLLLLLRFACRCPEQSERSPASSGANLERLGSRESVCARRRSFRTGWDQHQSVRG